MREGQVCGRRLTGGGSGMSIRPASGSDGGAASAMGSPPGRATSAAPAGPTAEQMADLLRRILGGAERDHGHAKIARPGEYVAQARLAHLENILAHAVAADIEADLQLAVADRHAAGGGEFALRRIVHQTGEDVVVLRLCAYGAKRGRRGASDIVC